MKTLHLETGRHLYGGGVQVIHLVEGLRAAGDEARILAPEGSEIVAAAAARGIPTHPFPFLGEADPRLIGALRRRIREGHPDLVHLHSRRGADTLGLWAAWRSGVPTVVSRRVDTPELPVVSRLKYRRCGRVIAISEAIRGVLLEGGVPPDHVVTIRSAIDADAISDTCRDRGLLRRAFGFPKDALVIAVVAQLIDRKGHDTLLDALPRVVGEIPRARLVIFGRGPRRAAIRARIERNDLVSRVHLAGHRDDLIDLLPCCDLVAHPARAEGLGIALLEAQAAGLPVVASRVGGIPEAVVDERTGVLVEPDDPASLARALIRLLADADLRARMGAEARAWVRTERSLAVMVRETRTLYEALLNDR
ncbi:MAG: glycosyltransferase family 4 protein [Longimicrobiales bacterium]|nr:glycosyltransferase family 4 protein [Longimicrobiales bacterium]